MLTMEDTKPDNLATGRLNEPWNSWALPAADDDPMALTSRGTEYSNSDTGFDTPDASVADGGDAKDRASDEKDELASDYGSDTPDASDTEDDDPKDSASNAAMHHRMLADPAALTAHLTRLGGINSVMPMDASQAIKHILDTFRDPKLVIQALGAYVKAHPYRTGLIVLSMILILNPVMLVGFGSGGVAAGSLAAAWQATMGGYIAAGSAYAALQTIGVTCAVVIPALGVGGLALTVAGPKVAVALKEACTNMVEDAHVKEACSNMAENAQVGLKTGWVKAKDGWQVARGWAEGWGREKND
ncbi:hypothetical protein FPV67DRAFT_1461990 [Lyophyllum atratum]|nr:hypothetical protein FPV67DRAFT_1461990 [Lyophyllum atratum]